MPIRRSRNNAFGAVGQTTPGTTDHLIRLPPKQPILETDLCGAAQPTLQTIKAGSTVSPGVFFLGDNGCVGCGGSTGLVASGLVRLCVGRCCDRS